VRLLNDTGLENRIFYISAMYEFSHSQGQKRSSGQVGRMSAIPPKAEVPARPCHVAEVPEADIGRASRGGPRQARSDRGDVSEARPEGILKAYAGLVTSNDHAALHDSGLHAEATLWISRRFRLRAEAVQPVAEQPEPYVVNKTFTAHLLAVSR